MLRASLRLLDKVPKGFLWGLGLGAATFLLSGIAFAVVYWTLRPFVWAALYGVPYSPPPGPYPVESGEWLFVKGIWFVSAIVLGFVATQAAGRSAYKVLLALLVIWLLWALASELLPSNSLLRIAIAYLNVPLGVLLGHILWRRHQLPSHALAEGHRDG